jgi:hypothetical protein
MPRLFRLIRQVDESGVSGVGHVADGCEFYDGTCVLKWRVAGSALGVYTSIGNLESIHGHNGATKIVWESQNEASLPKSLASIDLVYLDRRPARKGNW